MATNPTPLSELQNLGSPPVTRSISWADLVRREWGSEFNAPDRGVYQFSNGRQFDSTDTGSTGIYNRNLG